MRQGLFLLAGDAYPDVSAVLFHSALRCVATSRRLICLIGSGLPGVAGCAILDAGPTMP